MRPRPGVYLAEGTLFAARYARWNSSFHKNSGWLWSSKETQLLVWPFWGGEHSRMHSHAFEQPAGAASTSTMIP